MKTLQQYISKIIETKFSTGDYFDSHAVINEILIKKDSHHLWKRI